MSPCVTSSETLWNSIAGYSVTIDDNPIAQVGEGLQSAEVKERKTCFPSSRQIKITVLNEEYSPYPLCPHLSGKWLCPNAFVENLITVLVTTDMAYLEMYFN